MDQQVEKYLKWRDEQRQRHRVMNLSEYTAWQRGGDAISCPSDSNAFPGGITIEFCEPPIIGRFSNEGKE